MTVTLTPCGFAGMVFLFFTFIVLDRIDTWMTEQGFPDVRRSKLLW